MHGRGSSFISCSMPYKYACPGARKLVNTSCRACNMYEGGCSELLASMLAQGGQHELCCPHLALPEELIVLWDDISEYLHRLAIMGFFTACISAVHSKFLVNACPDAKFCFRKKWTRKHSIQCAFVVAAIASSSYNQFQYCATCFMNSWDQDW